MSISGYFRKVDDILFDRVFEPAATWTHTWFGCSNFSLARILSVFLLILLHVNSLKQTIAPQVRTSFLWVTALLTAFIILRSFALEQQMKKSVEGRCANSERADVLMMIVRLYVFCRVIESAIYAVFSGRDYWDVLIDATICALYYFLASSSRPKQRGRVLNLLFANRGV